jgi:hypothetical protein
MYARTYEDAYDHHLYPHATTCMQEWAPAVSSRVADAAKLEARAAMQQQEAQPCAHLLLQQGNGGEQPEPIFYKEIVVIRDVDWLEAKEIKAETVDFRSELELKVSQVVAWVRTLLWLQVVGRQIRMTPMTWWISEVSLSFR